MRTTTGQDLGTQLMVSKHMPDSTRMQAARWEQSSGYMNKPEGGLWTSTLVDGISDWIRWCRGEGFGNVDDVPWWTLEPEPGATLLQIDGWDDLDLMMRVYGRSWGPIAGMNRKSLDFDAIKQAGYAGVNLTEHGARECHFGDWMSGYSLNAWDCESTVWLRWSFAVVAPVAREVVSA